MSRLLRMILVLGVLGGLGWVGWQIALGESVPGLAWLLPGDAPKAPKAAAGGGKGAARSKTDDGTTSGSPGSDDAPGDDASIQTDDDADVHADTNAVAVDDAAEDRVPTPIRPPQPGGLVGLLTRIEQLGREAGVSCGGIEMDGEQARLVRLSGEGGVQAVAGFLARLEQDAHFAGVSNLHIASTVPGLVEIELEVEIERLADGVPAPAFRYGSWPADMHLPDVFVPREPSPVAPQAQAMDSPEKPPTDTPSTTDTDTDTPSDRTEHAPTHPAPTVSQTVDPASRPRHDVSVVLAGSWSPCAVVDSLVVHVGDRLEAGEVVQIHERGVVVRSANEVLEYALGAPKSPPRVLAEVPGS